MTSNSPPRPDLPVLVAALGVIAYLLTPSAPVSLLGSWPLTPAGAAVFVVAAALAVLGWHLRDRGAAPRFWIAAAIGLVVLRAVTATAAPPQGWLASYYANDAWSGRPQWSSDFRHDSATRIDRSLSFGPGDFPVHYLNGPAFTEGAERHVAEPMSVEWRGIFAVEAPETITIEATGIGPIVVQVNGSEVSGVQSAPVAIAVDAGRHSVMVRYRKAAGSDGALRTQLRQADGASIKVFPEGAAPAWQPLIDRFAVALDVLVVVLLAAAAFQALVAAFRSTLRVPALVGASLLLVLGAQGYVAAMPFTRFHTLTGGDDWLGFESRAREILQHGVLMPLDAAIGSGTAYFYHPFYSYLLAGVHALTGESLFGAIFTHFVLLAITALLMFGFARRWFGTQPAVIGVVALVAVFEIDFIRYYTITLLSENLYVLTVTCCLLAFAKWAESGRTAALVQAGMWGGLSAATRPVMMVFLPFALAVTAAIAHRDRRRPGPWVSAAIAFGAWMICVLPFTLRNWIVARQFVLISAGQGGAVIEHNIPPALDAAPYLEAYRSGQAGTLAVLWTLLIEHPAAVVALQIKKLGFTLGMVHWFDGYRPHPELLVVTGLYLSMLVFSRTMRRPELWPVHAFVISHWASMSLTSPWNYGYRLILPPYVYTTTLSCAAAAALLRARGPARLR